MIGSLTLVIVMLKANLQALDQHLCNHLVNDSLESAETQTCRVSWGRIKPSLARLNEGKYVSSHDSL